MMISDDAETTGGAQGDDEEDESKDEYYRTQCIECDSTRVCESTRLSRIDLWILVVAAGVSFGQ